MDRLSLPTMPDEAIICKICNQRLRDPLVLACLHSYCRKDVETVFSTNGVLSCPQCGKETPYGFHDGIPSLKPDFLANQWIDALKVIEDSATCDICLEKEPGKYRCPVCMIFLCDLHGNGHRRGRETREHRIISVGDLKDGISPAFFHRPTFCPDHTDQQMKVHCADCNVPICSECTLSTHQGHRCSYLHAIYPAHDTNLRDLLKLTKERITSLEDIIRIVRDTEQTLDARAKIVSDEVKTEFAELRKMIDQREQRLLAEVETVRVAKGSNLRMQHDQLDSVRNIVRSGCDFVDRVLTHCNEVEVLTLDTTMTLRLNELASLKVDRHPREDPSVRFVQLLPSMEDDEQHAHNIRDVIQSYGDVITNTSSHHHDRSRSSSPVRRDPLTYVTSISPSPSSPEPGRRGVSVSPSGTTAESISPLQKFPPLPPLEDSSSSEPLALTSRDYSAIRQVKRVFDYKERPGGFALRKPTAILANPGNATLLVAQGDGLYMLTDDGLLLKKVSIQELSAGSTFEPSYPSLDIAQMCLVPDGSGRVLAADRGKGVVHLLDSDLRVLKSFGGGQSTTAFSKPLYVGVAASKHESYVTDSKNSCIHVFRLDGTFARRFGAPGFESLEFKQPGPIGWFDDPTDGQFLYVADSGNARIQVVRPDGTFVRKIGVEGRGDRHFSGNTLGLAVNDKVLAVTDYGNSCAQIFYRSNGVFVNRFNVGESNGPLSVSIDRKGDIYVADGDHSKMMVF
mmetsp:Transcript_48579/g.80819  ORF Transcript_48579/g.80819 Transcript_48579/m.80819 type:complete len:737 (-) Transcript_48579:16-2226(-)